MPVHLSTALRRTLEDNFDTAGNFIGLPFANTTAPALAPAGAARLYFDRTSNVLKMSVNGGAYVEVATAGLGGTFTTLTATGATTLLANTPVTNGGVAGIILGSSTTLGIYVGSGAPTVSAAQGSLYIRSDGSTINNRTFINTNSATTWTAITTVL